MSNDEVLDTLLRSAEALEKSGSSAAALAIYEQGCEQYPESSEVRCRCVDLLLALGRMDDAANYYRRFLDSPCADVQMALALGKLLTRRGVWQDAELVYRTGLADNPDHLELHVALGDFLASLDRNSEACYFMRRAVAISPDSLLALNGLGFVLRCLSRYGEAEVVLGRALALDERSAQAWVNLAICKLQQGRSDEAIEAYKKAIAIDAKHWGAWKGLLLTSHYQGLDRDGLYRLHRDYGALFPSAEIQHSNPVERSRRIRIGFVSGDFRRHSVGYFIKAVLTKLDRGAFELWAYYTYPTDDYRTESFRRLFTRWRHVYGSPDNEFCEQIRKDGIDILVDLSGHTSLNRLPAFAQKPAPIQVSWIGYPDTTGLSQMDYRLTDSFADPEGCADSYHVERLWRMPHSFLCYTPSDHAPDVGPAPCLSRGFVTFGSFSMRMKIGPECLALWVRVLQAVPNSRLFLKSAIGYQNSEARAAMRALFEAHGIAAERVEVVAPKLLLADHLAAYEEIDIALDTFPYHGTTTTCEALWMGVPVVSLAGEHHVSRVGVSLLSNAGLADLVADSEDEYVEIAAQLASDFQNLALIRGALRGVLKGSRLLDDAGMAADFAAAMRSMWHLYCDKHPASGYGAIPDPDVKVATEALPAAPRLIVGGIAAVEGWKIFSAKPGDGIDYDGDLCYLHQFGDNDFSEIYCAHILQRLGQGEVAAYLKDLHRMLVPGGRLYLSVPDMDVLAWMLASPAYDKATKFGIMRALFGSQTDEADFNHIGLNLDFLRDYLRDAGYSDVELVASFGLFADASEANVGGIPISLNLVVVK